MPSVDRDPYFPPARFGGVPTGALHGGEAEQTYGQMVASRMAARWGVIPSGLTHDQVLAIVYPSPSLASIGDGPYVKPGAPTMALSAEQEAYIAKVRSELHGEWAAIREQEHREAVAQEQAGVAAIRARGPIVLEGEALRGDYDDDDEVGGVSLTGAMFGVQDPSTLEERWDQTYVSNLGRVRVTIEFLEEVTDA